MNLKKLAILLFIFFSSLFLINLGGSKDLVATLAHLPGLADTPEKGAFVDLVKAIDEVYTDGKIIIEVYPFARSIQNIIDAKADFHIPCLRNPLIDQSKLPYRFASDKMGIVTFVIYSHIEKPITRKMLDDAIAKKGKFPYNIHLAGGVEDAFPFPGVPTNDIESALKKIESKRIDALVFAQDEVDLTLKKLKLKSIFRDKWGDFEDTFIIPKGTEGEKINKILSDALKKLRASGKLQKLYSKIHKPYENWQPSKMGW